MIGSRKGLRIFVIEKAKVDFYDFLQFMIIESLKMLDTKTQLINYISPKIQNFKSLGKDEYLASSKSKK